MALPNFKTCVDALPADRQPEVVELFDKYGVSRRAKLQSRHDIYLEQYVQDRSTSRPSSRLRSPGR